jgi:hypothetical protein
VVCSELEKNLFLQEFQILKINFCSLRVHKTVLQQIMLWAFIPDSIGIQVDLTEERKPENKEKIIRAKNEKT